MRLVTALLLSAFLPAAAAAQPFLDIDEDGAIPTLDSVVGHAPGEEITTPAEALLYFDVLKEAASERMRIERYATSWLGRPLVYAVIGSEEHMDRLDEIKTDLDRLASGDALPADERERLIAETPAVVWLSYGVHGDEISSTDAGLALARHLLAARGDETVDAIMENTIVVIDPMQNPDGRARFLASFTQDLGIEPQADRYAAEHDQPWPGGRYNAAFFDLNRDWFALTQPETRGKVQAILEWNPVVLVDAHEMGGDESYFFAPSAEPFNPQIEPEQKDAQRLIGINNAGWFDRFGIPYFTREVYDAFYPGYGDMWPTLGGAVAMTYEQGSARGLVFERKTGEELTYEEGVRNHFLATLSTAEAVARNKREFLRRYADLRRSAVEEARSAADRYAVLDAGARGSQALALARRLSDQGIEVRRAEGPVEICGTDYPEGAFIVDKAQPQGRLISTLLDEETPLPAAFLEEQEERRRRGLRAEIYDVTAWSVPLMSGVDAQACRNVDISRTVALGETGDERTILPQAAFGYALPWDDAGQARLLVAALRAGLSAKASEEPFVIDGRLYPAGSVIFSKAANDDTLRRELSRLSRQHEARLVPLETSWAEDGPNYGSEKFSALALPRIAMAWGEGVSPTEAGAARYVLERRLGLPVAPIRTRTIGRADLDRYDVLILPETRASFLSTLGDRGAEAIAEYAEEGGVVISFGSATADVADEAVGLLSSRRENALPMQEADAASDEEASAATGTAFASEAEYRQSIADMDARPDRVSGVLLSAKADPDHWLSAGYDDLTALYSGNAVWEPLGENEGRNVIAFESADDVLQSGYLWDEMRRQLAYKPFVMVEPRGEGMLIAFTQSPVTRGYLNGLDLLVANAVLFGPAHTD